MDDAVFGVGGGDDELDAGRLEVLRLEYAERIVALDHHQDRGAVRDLAVVDHDRALEADAVAGRAADQLDVVDLPVDRRDDGLLGVRQAVDQQQREHVARAAGAPPAATRCAFSRRTASVARSTPKRSMSVMSSLCTRKPSRGKAMSSRPPCIMPEGPISPAVEQPETGTPGKASLSAAASTSAS